MVFNSENEMGVTTKSDETAEDSKSTSSSGIVTDCSSNNDDDDNSRSSSSADDDYVWTMSEELREFATMELGETDETRASGLTKLRAYISEQPHLRGSCRTDNVFLLRFLRAQKFNVDKSAALLEQYLLMREKHPLWFKNLGDVESDAVSELMDSGFVLFLPGRDSGGRRVLLNCVNRIDTAARTNSDMMRAISASLETVMEDEETQIRGVAYIFYCKDISMAHVAMWQAQDAYYLFVDCEKSLPVRHLDINMVRLPFAIRLVLEFVKTLLSKKIRRRVHTISDERKLRQKFDPSILPSELGGSAGPVNELGEAWRAQVCRNKESLARLDSLLDLDEGGVRKVEEAREKAHAKASSLPALW